MIRYKELGLRGRLGNALFELASTVGVAKLRGEPCVFNADWTHRPFFSVPDDMFSDNPQGIDAWTVPECSFMDPRCAPYMQAWPLVEPVLPLVREYLQPSELAESIIAEREQGFSQLPQPILGVHVRRGDNIVDPGVPNKSEYHVTPPLEFYKEGIELLRPRVASVAVFSDDPDWCEANLDADFYYHGVSRPKEHEPDFLTADVLDFVDLFLLSRCEAHVVSGSTFGIWGALLADSGAVVRPSNVYGPMLSFIDSELLFPPNWVRLDY